MVWLLEPVLDHEVQIVTLVEDLAADVRVVLPEQLHLLVLLRDQLLVHGRDLDVEIVVGQVEVGSEELDRDTVLEPYREDLGLVLPRNAVEIEEKRELSLTVVSELDLVRRLRFGAQVAPNSATPASSISSSGNN
jgi:hypothetical protein